MCGAANQLYNRHSSYLYSFSVREWKLRLFILDWPHSYSWWHIVIWLLYGCCKVAFAVSLFKVSPTLHHKHSSLGYHREMALCWHSNIFIVGCNIYRISAALYETTDPSQKQISFSGDSVVFLVSFIRCHWKVYTKMETCFKQYIITRFSWFVFKAADFLKEVTNGGSCIVPVRSLCFICI
jgi:hypothetical protein